MDKHVHLDMMNDDKADYAMKSLIFHRLASKSFVNFLKHEFGFI